MRIVFVNAKHAWEGASSAGFFHLESRVGCDISSNPEVTLNNFRSLQVFFDRKMKAF